MIAWLMGQRKSSGGSIARDSACDSRRDVLAARRDRCVAIFLKFLREDVSKMPRHPRIIRNGQLGLSMPPTPTETFDDEGDTPAQPPSALKTEKEARLERGTGLLKKGQFEEAAKAFEEAIAADATDARAHNRLSLALKKQGEAALELDAAAASGHFEAARKACDEAIRLDPARFAHRADKFEALRARARAHAHSPVCGRRHRARHPPQRARLRRATAPRGPPRRHSAPVAARASRRAAPLGRFTR